MILGVGLVSLATLFPIGLLRLRDATRSTRTKYLVDSAAADGTDAVALEPADPVGGGGLNQPAGLDQFSIHPVTNIGHADAGGGPERQRSGPWNPLIRTLPFRATFPRAVSASTRCILRSGYGLPFAYDPLWRYQTPRDRMRFPAT